MTEPRKYHSLGSKQLRDWIHVEIEDNGESKTVTFVSKFHVGNRFPNAYSYSADFTDHEILCDRQLTETCVRKFGPDVFVGSIHI